MATTFLINIPTERRKLVTANISWWNWLIAQMGVLDYVKTICQGIGWLITQPEEAGGLYQTHVI